MATQTTYMNRVIGGESDISEAKVTDGDGKEMRIECWVSPADAGDGQTVIEVFGDDYTMVCLDFTAAHRLMLALSDALNLHAAQIAD